MPPKIDMLGKRVGMLTVVEELGSDKGHILWRCVCDCGRETKTRTGNLTTQSTKSCGCLRKIQEHGKATKKIVIGLYKRNARLRGFEWSLTDEQFFDLTQKNCFYCNTEPSRIQRSACNNGDLTYNGIDRIDNTKGYSMANCVTCCNECNVAKSNKSLKAFVGWIDKVSERMKQYKPPQTRKAPKTEQKNFLRR